MTSPESKRALEEEWARENAKRRASPKDLLKSHAAPFFVTWIVFAVAGFCVVHFAFGEEIGFSIVLGVFAGLIAGLRIILKVRR
jgi:hypothetical protein